MLSCHGFDGGGVEGRGPSLAGAGEAAADFYLRTGRMPLGQVGEQPLRGSARYSDAQIRALDAYVGSLGPGPGIPAVRPERGSLSEGMRLFTESCAGCHGTGGKGGVAIGAYAPPLGEATPTQVGEAIRVGPYVMPRFSEAQLDAGEVDSIARYVQLTQDPDDAGGLGIGHIGPVPEGLVAWLAALAALLLVARLIGEGGGGSGSPRDGSPEGGGDGMRSLLLAPLRWTWRLLLAGIALLLSRPRSRQGERELPASPGAESAVAGLLFAAALAGLAFVLLYAFDGGDTQLLGAAIAAGLGLVGAALILASARVLPRERREEERPELAVPLDERERRRRDHEADRVGYRLREGVDGVTRRRLLGAAGAAAGLGLGAAALTPLASLGPRVGERLRESPWRDGTALVEENDLPVRADELEVGSFLTAFAAGADKRDLAAAVVVVRVEESQLELPPERRDWAPEGLLAFSKICTHAQCAVSLFRYPLFAERSPGPALVCPCHYSTFDVLKGGERIFGPAVRPLPQLPLRIEAGRLLAAGPLSGAVGASWGGVREA